MRTWAVGILSLAAVGCAHTPPKPPVGSNCVSSTDAESAALALLEKTGQSAEHRISEPSALDFDEQRWLIRIPKRANVTPANSNVFVRKSDCETTWILKVTLRRGDLSTPR